MGHVTVCSWRLTTACCLVVGSWLVLGLGIGLDLVSGWLVAIHMCLYHFSLPLSLRPINVAVYKYSNKVSSLLLIIHI